MADVPRNKGETAATSGTGSGSSPSSRASTGFEVDGKDSSLTKPPVVSPQTTPAPEKNDNERSPKQADVTHTSTGTGTTNMTQTTLDNESSPPPPPPVSAPGVERKDKGSPPLAGSGPESSIEDHFSLSSISLSDQNMETESDKSRSSQTALKTGETSMEVKHPSETTIDVASPTEAGPEINGKEKSSSSPIEAASSEYEKNSKVQSSFPIEASTEAGLEINGKDQNSSSSIEAIFSEYEKNSKVQSSSPIEPSTEAGQVIYGKDKSPPSPIEAASSENETNGKDTSPILAETSSSELDKDGGEIRGPEDEKSGPLKEGGEGNAEDEKSGPLKNEGEGNAVSENDVAEGGDIAGRGGESGGDTGEVRCGFGGFGMHPLEAERLRRKANNELRQDAPYPCRVFVKNIGFRQSARDMKMFFGEYGRVIRVTMLQNPATHKSRGMAFVEFSTEEAAQRCLIDAEDGGIEYLNRHLEVSYANEKKASFNQYPTIPILVPVPFEELEIGATMPTEVWVKIFSYLTLPEQIRVERVCKSFREATLRVWSQKRVLKCEGFHWRLGLTEKALTSILRRCGNKLWSLDLGPFTRDLNENTTTIIAHYCPGLRKLNMQGVDATNLGMKTLTFSAHHLVWVNIQKCKSIREKGLWWLLKNCQQLSSLDICGNAEITGKCFYMVGPELTCLNASGCGKLVDYSLEQVRAKCPNVAQIRVSGCLSLTVSCLQHLSMMPNLEILDLSRNFAEIVADESTWMALGKMHNLKELRLDYITQITDNILNAIVNGCPQLRVLTLQGCRPHVTCAGLISLIDLQELSTLDLSYIDAVDDRVLRCLAVEGQLQKLVIRICPAVTDKGVSKVISLSPRLEMLDVSGNIDLTLSALSPLCDTIVNRPADLPIKVTIGGTLMSVPDSAVSLSRLRERLPLHVTLTEVDRSNSHYDPDGTVIMPPREDPQDDLGFAEPPDSAVEEVDVVRIVDQMKMLEESREPPKYTPYEPPPDAEAPWDETPSTGEATAHQPIVDEPRGCSIH